MPTQPQRAIGVLLLCLVAATVARSEPQTEIQWPQPTQSAKPWTRWWWHGSAVNNQDITRLLEEYHRAGIGGVEITCIYGVKGQAENNRDYRTQEWVDAVRHTIAEARRLGMGVDMPAGSGWRMGGPQLKPEFANSRLVLDSHKVSGPQHFSHSFGRTTPQAAVARDQDGQVVDLTNSIHSGKLSWHAPQGDWSIDTAAFRWAGDRVKRPGPGGAGLNINPFWSKSVGAFLDDFSETLAQTPGLRAQFHDSFEYEGDWQPEFFREFEQRRGYKLQLHLPQLAGRGEPERVGRVKADYRATLSELVRDDLVRPWVAWSHRHNLLARNQSHGSPANWLDLYAACDIPETESFGRLFGGDANLLMMKFASSAANVSGKQLTSSESATWLDEHFHVSLGQIRQLVDRQILSGVNHVLYHGTAYSPASADWPGWLFYASTQVNPQNPVWRDLPALNAYVTRCQSLLQSSQHDNDILLYWPLHDFWHNPRGLRAEIRVHNFQDWFKGRPLGDAAETLHRQGYCFDYVSDHLLQDCKADDNGRVTTGNGAYRAVLIPGAVHLPVETMEKLAELAQAGCPVLFLGNLPQSPPGLKGLAGQSRWEQHQQRFKTAARRVKQHASQGDDLTALLDQPQLRCEGWASDVGLAFLRKRSPYGTLYFLHNQTAERFDGWIAPTELRDSAMLLEPASGKIGSAAVRQTHDAHEVRLQLEPGDSLFLLTTTEQHAADPWVYDHPTGKPVPLEGTWSADFIAGGPSLPASFHTSGGPTFWTESDDPAAAAFAGTVRYTCKFDAPGKAERWRLNLGEIDGSAVVRLNGRRVASLIGPHYNARLESLADAGNELQIDVTGVAANRIRDLDRRGVNWRIFEDINLVTINYRPFDASQWPVRKLGLNGPVTLTPLESANGPPSVNKD